jgi:hypothetical protein
MNHSAPLRARGPSSAAADAGSFAASQRFTPTAPPPSALRDVMDIVIGVVVLLGMLLALACLAHYTRDSMAVGRALTDEANTKSSLVCKDGRIARGDGSLPDLVLEDGVFVCTDWRTQQALELEQSQKGWKRY